MEKRLFLLLIFSLLLTKINASSLFEFEYKGGLDPFKVDIPKLTNCNVMNQLYDTFDNGHIQINSNRKIAYEEFVQVDRKKRAELNIVYKKHCLGKDTELIVK